MPPSRAIALGLTNCRTRVPSTPLGSAATALWLVAVRPSRAFEAMLTMKKIDRPQCPV
jgi:hypothetical protein